ncbi:MAG TPA: endolytic transglycosylase MltG [Rhizomicrobium sp.]|nr:endolytic transglycosylase MltG [Rhizomicrobium sp.]
MRRLLVFAVLAALLAAAAWYGEQWNYLRPGPSEKGTVVLVKPGEGSAGIAQQLQRAGVIANANLFRLGLRLRNQQSQLKAGEYWFPAHASLASVAGILISGKSIEYKLTAAEGLTSEMIYRLVEADTVLVGDAGPVPQEGTLLPETYLFTRGTTRAALLQEMHQAQQKFLAAHWASRAGGLPVSSPRQAVILASVVEKETSIPEERRHIASVFENRLKQGIKLESDPTIIYGLTRGYPLGRGIRESELTRATPYNTYVIAGLPPTPICNPGKDAIAAVLDPEQTSDLYFVANGTGGHSFTSNFAEHQKNVARLRQIEKGHH